jgi:hypothetical protein
MEENFMYLNQDLYYKYEDYISNYLILNDDLNISLFENELIDSQKMIKKKTRVKTEKQLLKEKERNKKRKEKFLLKSEDEKKIERKRNAVCAQKFRLRRKEELKGLLEENQSLKIRVVFLKKKISSLESFISENNLFHKTNKKND